MTQERLFTWRNRWFTVGVGALVAMAVLSALVGFVWLPSVQRDFAADGLWASICRAAGVPTAWSDPAAVAPRQSRPSTSVVMLPALGRQADAVEVGRGATLALQCSMCHGAKGLSDANFPNLAGQYPEVIYKQLHDFRDGNRRNAVMQALASGLSDRDIRDLAAYYAYLPRPTRPASTDEDGAPVLVRVGAPLRNIAPCASCHGGIDQKAGSPWLEGLPAVYVREQLQAFAAGERRNDALAQMRNVARQLSEAEIRQIATYYASRPDTPERAPAAAR